MHQKRTRCLGKCKEIAHTLDCKAYRAVGNALNKNPHGAWNVKDMKHMVPCHRVVASDGSLGGFALGSKKKIEVLRMEGIGIKNNKVINFDKMLHTF